MYFFPREIPAVRLGLWFILGIIFSSVYPSFPYIYALFSIGILLIGILFVDGYNNTLIKGLLICTLLFSIGFSRYSIEEQYLPEQHFEQQGFTRGYMIGVIQEDLITKKKYRTKITVEYISEDGNNYARSCGNLLVYLAKDSLSESLEAGDRINITGKILPIRPNGNPYSFNFKNYLHHRSINHQCYLKSNDWQLMSSNHLGPLKNLTRAIRKDFLGILKKYIPGESEEAIGAALVLGYRNLLTENIYDAYTDTGSVHVLAVSGLHLGIITGMLIWIFSLFKSESRFVEIFKMIFIILFIWMFALITGSAPAVLRAATMFSLFIIGKTLFKETNTYNILSASAIILLLYDPFLLFQASFQFSYLALTSILYFQPKLSVLWIPKFKIVRFIWNLAILAIAAQILVFPITVYYFHKFPLYFALSGIVAVPFAGIILWISVFLFLCEYLCPIINHILGPLLNVVLKFFLKIILMIQELPFCSLDGILIDFQQMIIIYLTLILIMVMYTFRIKRLIYPILILAVSFTIGSSFSRIKTQVQKELVIYDTHGGIVLDVFHGNTCYSIQDSTTTTSAIAFAASNYRLNKQVKNKKVIKSSAFYQDSLLHNYYGYISTLGLDILLLNEKTKIPETSKIKVNYLIINNLSKEKLVKAIKMVSADEIVLTSALPYWKKKEYLEILSDYDMYDISISGAFIRSI